MKTKWNWNTIIGIICITLGIGAAFGLKAAGIALLIYGVFLLLISLCTGALK